MPTLVLMLVFLLYQLYTYLNSRDACLVLCTCVVMDVQVAHARLECSEAKGDRAKIFEMMELLKAKYITLTQEKASLNVELIKVSAVRCDAVACTRACLRHSMPASGLESGAAEFHSCLRRLLKGLLNQTHSKMLRGYSTTAILRLLRCYEPI